MSYGAQVVKEKRFYLFGTGKSGTHALRLHQCCGNSYWCRHFLATKQPIAVAKISFCRLRTDLCVVQVFPVRKCIHFVPDALLFFVPFMWLHADEETIDMWNTRETVCGIVSKQSRFHRTDANKQSAFNYYEVASKRHCRTPPMWQQKIKCVFLAVRWMYTLRTTYRCVRNERSIDHCYKCVEII